MMSEIVRPTELDEHYGSILRSRKVDFVTTEDGATSVAQHGAATITLAGWPGWPSGLEATDPVIETFVAGPNGVTATSDNPPFVSAWTPLADWMNTSVRDALASSGVQLAGDGYVTASLTHTELLEGLAHLDDDQFVPGDSVSMVAIIGELAGPRVATGTIGHQALRPMAPLVFPDETLDAFANNQISHCAAKADELVVFPQFGQIHAGPAARHVAHLAPNRQLLVMRAAVSLS